MERIPPAGYREIEHTADWELEVWAPTFARLLELAAEGMYALAGTRFAPGQRHPHTLELQASDRESLLVRWLSELLYLSEQEGLGFDGIGVQLDGLQLRAELQGAPIAEMDKEIKAVTWHNLQVINSERGVEASVVFDV